MGVDIDGKIILGNTPGNFSKAVPDDIHDWADDNGLTSASPYYDAPPEDCIFGFHVEDIDAKDITVEWLNRIQEKAEKFKELTGCGAILYGMQNVW